MIVYCHNTSTVKTVFETGSRALCVPPTSRTRVFLHRENGLGRRWPWTKNLGTFIRTGLERGLSTRRYGTKAAWFLTGVPWTW